MQIAVTIAATVCVIGILLAIMAGGRDHEENVGFAIAVAGTVVLLAIGALRLLAYFLKP